MSGFLLWLVIFVALTLSVAIIWPPDPARLAAVRCGGCLPMAVVYGRAVRP